MLKEGIKTFKFVKEIKNLTQAQDDVSRKKALLYIKEILGNEGGLLLKMLQYMGTKQADIDEVLRSNDSDKTIGISRDEVIKILKSKYGEQFSKIENISTQAYPASVGQVHRAKLDSGEEVAIKVQYPNIKSVFKDQLRLLKLLPTMTNMTGMKKWGIDFSHYQKNLEKMITQECDYSFEVNELNQWEEFLANHNHCHVPKVFEAFSKSDVYIQEFIEGDFLDTVVHNWSSQEKKKVATILTEVYFDLFFNHKVAQGDTNFGNFIFSRNLDDVNVNFIDLGQSVSFSPKFVLAIAKALSNEISGTDYSRVGLLEDIGFDAKKLQHIASKADLIVEILFEPFLANYSYNIKSWKYKESLDLLLGEDKWWFRSAGGSEFFFFMKSFMGIKNIITQLDVSVFYNKILKDLLGKFKFNDFEISNFELADKYKMNTHGKHLIVLITENSIEKVKLSLPFTAIFDLGEYLDEQVQLNIKEQGHNIEELIRVALADGGKPKDIFDIKTTTREYLVKIA